MAHVLKHSGHQPTILDFSPYGYDERQYCSPGFNLPVGLFQRSKFGAFPEYHTSADNLDLIGPAHLESSYRMIAGLIVVLENNLTFRNTSPKGEPQLGKRGLYGAIGGGRIRRPASWLCCGCSICPTAATAC
jgi:aminopeptidase-like protein